MDENRGFEPNGDALLMDRVGDVLRFQHYAIRTEGTYCF